MKKLLTSLMVLTLFIGAGSAFAEGEEPVVTPSSSEVALTTQKYVDDGLIYVYGKAKAAQTTANTAVTAAGNAQTAADAAQADVDALETTVSDLNDTVEGHTDTLEDLQSQIDALEAASSDTTYQAGTGITISGNNNAVSVAGLANTEAGKRYIYKDGVLTELEVANNWNPNILGD